MSVAIPCKSFCDIRCARVFLIGGYCSWDSGASGMRGRAVRGRPAPFGAALETVFPSATVVQRLESCTGRIGCWFPLGALWGGTRRRCVVAVDDLRLLACLESLQGEFYVSELSLQRDDVAVGVGGLPLTELLDAFVVGVYVR